jgi:hypothetical protein
MLGFCIASTLVIEGGVLSHPFATRETGHRLQASACSVDIRSWDSAIAAGHSR